MNYFEKFRELELMDMNDTYHSLKNVCSSLTNKHLPKYLFFEVWCKIDHLDWEIYSDCYHDFLVSNYDYCYKERGAFKYKKRNKPVMRLKKLYTKFQDYDEYHSP